MEKTTAASILSDKNKIDQLTKYLILSLEAHKQGNPKQLNQILDELENEKADPDSIKVWLNIFSKVLTDSLRQTSIDCSPLIDFVLYKSKWLVCGSNHSQVFEYYGKFCLALILIRNSYLSLIMKLLVQSLVPKELYEENLRKKNVNIVIGKTSFMNLHDLKQYVTAIIKNPRYDLSSSDGIAELDPEHSKFMQELFTYHPKSKQKLKNFSKILIGYSVVADKQTRCFFIQKDNSEKEDISYIKACEGVYDAFAEQCLTKGLDNSQEILTENILNFIVKIFKLYPLSVNQFPNILREVFPHKRLDEAIQTVFFISILKLAIKCEKLRTPILNICLEKLIQIDVEIKPDAKGRIRNELGVEMAKKLDCLLLIFFDYFDYCFAIRERNEKNCFGEIPKRPSGEEASQYLEKLLENFFDLLDIFQANLLMTYQSKYVQYIFFYLCSFVEIYPDFMQHFLSRLITNMRSDEEKKFIKINSVHYLRSISVRAKFIPFPILQKALGFVIDYLKSFIKITRKKLSKNEAQSKEQARYEKIQLSASSKYRDRLTENSAREQEGEYKQLFQKYDMFYYINYAIVYILSYNSEAFIANGQYKEYQTYVGLLQKYNDFFKTIKFLPKSILIKFKDAIKSFASDDDDDQAEILKLIEGELETGEEEKEAEVRGDIFLEKYLPYDPNFLNRSKKVLIASYSFMDEQEEEADGMNAEEDENEKVGGNNKMESDISDDERGSDNMSSYSKHETDVSNDHLKILDESSKRKSKPLKDLAQTKKKIKPTSDFMNSQNLQAAI